MANEFVIKKGYKSLDNSEITGSLTTTGDITINGGNLDISSTMSSSPTSIIYLDISGTNVNGGGGSIVFDTSATGGSLTNYNAQIRGVRASGGSGGDSQLEFWTTLVSDQVAPKRRAYFSKTGHFYPGLDSTYNIGSNTQRFANIYADNLYGDGSNLTNVTVTDNTKVAKIGDTMSGNLTITKSSATMKVSETGGGDVRMVAGGATGYIGTYNNYSLQILQNSGAAITIDTSKNATFAGQIITTTNQISSNIATTSAIRLKPTSTTNTTGKSSIFLGTSPVDNYGISLRGARLGSDGIPTFELATHNNSANGTVALSIDSSQNATFAGDITLNGDNPTLKLDDSNGRSADLRVVGNEFSIRDISNNASIFTTDLSANPTTTTFNTVATFTRDITLDNAKLIIDPDAAGSVLVWKESDSSTTAGQLRGYGNRGDIYLYKNGTKTTEISSHTDSFIPALHIGGTSGVSSGVLEVTGNANVTGDLIVTGTVTAQEFHTEFVSASIVYESGSTKFGDTSDDVHNFTGSLNILSGSATIEGPGAEKLTLLNSTNSGGVSIKFSDQTGGSQPGLLTYRHTDSQSIGGGSSFHFTGEPDNVLVVGDASNAGRVVVKSQGSDAEVDYGFYSDRNTGMLRTSTDNVSLVAGGVRGVGVGTTAVSLKYAGSTKLATSNTGVTVTGDIDADDITIDAWGSVSASLSSIQTAGGVNGTGSTNRLAIWSDTDTLTSDAGLSYANDTLNISDANYTSISINSDVAEHSSIHFLSSSFNVGRIGWHKQGYFAVSAMSVNPSPAMFLNAPNGLDLVHNSTGSLSIKSGSADVIIDEKVNLGIGVASPGYKLEVDGTTRIHNRLTFGGNVNNFIEGTGSSLDFKSNGEYYFKKGTDTHLTILSGGNVGIGTNNPGASLHVASTTNDYVAKFSHSTATGYAPGSILLQAGQATSRGQGLFHYNTEADESWFTGVPYNVSSKKWIVANKYTTTFDPDVAQLSHALLTVDSDTGNAGIGISSPVAKLHVYQNDTEVDTAAGITIEQDGTGDAALSFLLTGIKRWRLGIDNSDSDKFKISTSTNLASDNKVTIDTSGNVGIGTTNPGNKLHIKKDDSSEDAIIKIEQDGTGDAVIDYLLTSTNMWRVGVDNSDGDSFKWGIGDLDDHTKLRLSTAGNLTAEGTIDADDITIDNWGSVSASLASIQNAGGVDGSGTANYLPIWTDSDTLGDSILSSTGGDLILNGSDDNPHIYINPSGGDIGDTARVVFNDRAQVGWIDSAITLTDGGGNKDIKLKVNTGSIFLQTSNSTRMTIDDGGDTTFAGGVTITTSNSPGLKISKDKSVDNRFLRLNDTA